MSMCLYSLQFSCIVFVLECLVEIVDEVIGLTDEFVSVDCRLHLHVYDVDISFMM